jgi:hypothetical protein
MVQRTVLALTRPAQMLKVRRLAVRFSFDVKVNRIATLRTEGSLFIPESRVLSRNLALVAPFEQSFHHGFSILTSWDSERVALSGGG